MAPVVGGAVASVCPRARRLRISAPSPSLVEADRRTIDPVDRVLWSVAGGIEGAWPTPGRQSGHITAPRRGDYDLLAVAQAMRSMSELVDKDPGTVERLVEIAGEQVSGACWASVSQLRGDRFDSDAPSWPA